MRRQGRNHSSQVGGTTLTYSGFTEKFWGDQYIDGPMDQKFGGETGPPVPMVVAPMCIDHNFRLKYTSE
jgi:hypothetical protein